MQNNEIFRGKEIPEFITVEELARLLRISRSGAYILVHTEGFPHIHLGKRLVIPKADLMRWLDDQQRKNPQSGDTTCADAS